MNGKKQIYHVIILIAVAFLGLLSIMGITARTINRAAEEHCYEQMEYTTRVTAEEFKLQIENNLQFVEVCASMLSGELNHPERMKDVLGVISENKSLLSMGIIFPDGSVLRNDGGYGKLEEGWDFESLAVMGSTISQYKKRSDGRHLIYCYAPVKNHGKTEGIVYGALHMERMVQAHHPSIYGGQADLFILEEESGNILVDTGHSIKNGPEEVSIYDLNENTERIHTSAVADTEDSGFLKIPSVKSTEDIYCRYQKLGIRDWIILLGVRENVIFKDAQSMYASTWRMAVLEGLLLTIVFLGFIYYERRNLANLKELLGHIQYMMDVKEDLMNAPREDAHMVKALHRVADKLSAECAFLYIFKRDMIETEYSWSRNSNGRCELSEGFPLLYQVLNIGEPRINYNLSAKRELAPEAYDFLEKKKIRSLMAVPIRNADEKIIGVLGVANMSKVWKDSKLLELVSTTFEMTCENKKVFQKSVRQSFHDNLTGLRNRNRYELDLQECQKTDEQRLACVYVDADGLRRMNNTVGHEAGDYMLKAIANTLSAQFGKAAYRIGGDEFVAFSIEDKPTIYRKVELVQSNLSKEGFHVSAGVAFRKDHIELTEMIKAAESEMYQQKQRYYRDSQKKEFTWMDLKE